MLNCAVIDDYQQVAERMADWQSLAPQVAVRFLSQPLEGNWLVAEIGDCEIVVIMRERTPFPAQMFARLPQLKLLVTSGMRNAAVDLAAAKAHGVVVCGTASRSEPPAELTWALITALMRNTVAEAVNLRAGGPWQISLGGDLAGRTLGLVGLGKIGQRVARVAQAFEMDVVAWSPNLTDSRAAAAGVRRVDKSELFATSDIVSIHLVLSDRTRQVVGAAEIAAMAPSAFLVNTSRAGLVDTAALIAALEAGTIAGYGVDVFDVEPLPPADPFRTLPNVLALPHLGYVSEANYAGYFGEAVENIAAFLRGRVLRPLK